MLLANHVLGSKECLVCWGTYPTRCKCGGLVHAEFEDEIIGEDGDETIALSFECDACGSTEDPGEQQ